MEEKSNSNKDTLPAQIDHSNPQQSQVDTLPYKPRRSLKQKVSSTHLVDVGAPDLMAAGGMNSSNPRTMRLSNSPKKDNNKILGADESSSEEEDLKKALAQIEYKRRIGPINSKEKKKESQISRPFSLRSDLQTGKHKEFGEYEIKSSSDASNSYLGLTSNNLSYQIRFSRKNKNNLAKDAIIESNQEQSPMVGATADMPEEKKEADSFEELKEEISRSSQSQRKGTKISVQSCSLDSSMSSEGESAQQQSITRIRRDQKSKQKSESKSPVLSNSPFSAQGNNQQPSSRPDNFSQQVSNAEEEIERLKKMQHMEILTQIGEAQPIFELPHKYAEGTDSPAWKKKQIRHQTLMKLQNIQENNSEESVSATDEGAAEQEKKNQGIQEKLKEKGEQIKFQTEKAIKVSKYPNIFKYLIYEGYRPQNLTQTRDYLNFLTKQETSTEPPKHMREYLMQEYETVLPDFINQSKILVFDQNFESGNIDSVYIHNCEEYNMLMKVDSNTRGNTYWFYFKVQNFRVGVKYVFNLYNFTRSIEKFYKDGMNIVVKSTQLDSSISKTTPRPEGCTSSVSAVTKKSKMNNMKSVRKDLMDSPRSAKGRSEALQGTEPRRSNRSTSSKRPSATFPKIEGIKKKEEESSKSESLSSSPSESLESKSEQEDEKKEIENDLQSWRYNQCKNIAFEMSEIPRSGQQDRPQNEKTYYGKLSFSYTFQERDEGCAVHFAYAIPYTYTNLIQDLEDAKQAILKKKQDEDETPKLRDLDKTNLDNSRLEGEAGVYVYPSMKDVIPYKQEQKRGNRQESRKDVLTEHHKKVSQYDLQHDNIKKQAQAQMNLKSSQFETQFINETVLNYDDPFKKDNFEIFTKYLHYKQEVLAQSIGGLNIFQITLTKRKEAGSVRLKKKSVIYIQARLHAAETHGSMIMKHVIRELSSNYEKYDVILNNHIIKLIPMVNPDGVVIGNSRSSLAGVDLNRRWGTPSATMHPEIYFLKGSMGLTSKQSNGISIFCDLHGHNKLTNCFFYGCNKAPNEGLLSWTKTRLLPKIFASQEPIFDFGQCKFSQEKTKYNTARVVVWNEFKVTNSFTLETSMHGKTRVNYRTRRGQVIQLEDIDFQSIGLNLLKSFRQYCYLEKELEKEFKATGGWLKKKKLDEFTGQAARKKIEQQAILDEQNAQRSSQNGSLKQARKFKAFRHQTFAIRNGASLQQNNQLPKKQQTSKNLFSGNQNLSPNKPLIKQQRTFNNSRHIPLSQIKIVESPQKERPSPKQSEVSVSNSSKNYLKIKTVNLEQEASSQFKKQAESSNKELQDSNDSLTEEGTSQPAQGASVTQGSQKMGCGKGDIAAIQKQITNSQVEESKRNLMEIKEGKKEPPKDSKPQKEVKDSKRQKTPKSTQDLPQNRKLSPVGKKKQQKGQDAKKGKAKETEMFLPSCLAEYFSNNEFTEAVKESRKPAVSPEKQSKAKQKQQNDGAESDSEPSCDNFENNAEIFSQALSEEERIEYSQPKKQEKVEQKKAEPLKVVVEESAFKEKDEKKYPKPVVEEIKEESNMKQIDEITSKINNIDDYRMLAEKIIEVKNETKKLNEKFQKLEKEINDQSSAGYMQYFNRMIPPQGQRLILNNNQYWKHGAPEMLNTAERGRRRRNRDQLVQNSQQIRGNLNELLQTRQEPRHEHYRQPSNYDQLQYESQPAEIQSMSAGPKSGEQHASQFGYNNTETDQFSTYNTGSMLPAVTSNEEQKQASWNQRHRGLQQQAAKQGKLKTRNSILNVGTYQMQAGASGLFQQPAIQAQKKTHAASHVHPEIIQRQNIASRAVRPFNQFIQPSTMNDQIIGQSMQRPAQQQLAGSPNINRKDRGSIHNTTTKKRRNLATLSKRQTMQLNENGQAEVEVPPDFQQTNSQNLLNHTNRPAGIGAGLGGVPNYSLIQSPTNSSNIAFRPCPLETSTSSKNYYYQDASGYQGSQIQYDSTQNFNQAIKQELLQAKFGGMISVPLTDTSHHLSQSPNIVNAKHNRFRRRLAEDFPIKHSLQSMNHTVHEGSKHQLSDTQNLTPAMCGRLSLGINKIEEVKGSGQTQASANKRERHSSRIRLVEMQRQDLQSSPLDNSTVVQHSNKIMPNEWLVQSPTSEKKHRPQQPDLIIKTRKKKEMGGF